MDFRFAGFWARVLVCLGTLFVLLGFIFAASALVLDMPWGKLTGQAVVEQMLAMVGLMVAGGYGRGAAHCHGRDVARVSRSAAAPRRHQTRVEERARRGRRIVGTPGSEIFQ